jgi:hypothetical protein
LSNEHNVRGIAGLLSDSSCTAASDPGPPTVDIYHLVPFTGMSLFPLEIVERHAIHFSHLSASTQRGVTRDFTGICYERDNSCLPVWYPDTSGGINPADDTSGGVFQALIPGR